MTASTSSGDADLTLDDLRLIDETCDRFEKAWQDGEPPELLGFLANASDSARPRLLGELLTLDLEYRRARGEETVAETYLGRFPGLDHVIDEVFAPGLADIARADTERTWVASSSSSGQATIFGEALPPAILSPGVRAAMAEEGYAVLGELGRGGMGVVYLARKIALNRLCAVKMILAGPHAGSATSARFRAEAETVARLSHPDIVKIYHIGEAEGLPFLELEYLPGGSLDKKLDGTPWPAVKAAGLIATVTSAIAEAHRQGIIHRDLKPANILLDAEGRPSVADFGLAKVLDSDGGLTKTRAVIGSPSYMAPEQAEGGSRNVSAATDVYALGVIFYELLTGRPPFRAATELETLAQVKGTDPVPPSQIQPGLPRDAETICLKCLEKAPARRYHSADELADDLRHFLIGEPIRARPTSPWERAYRWARRRPALASTLAVSSSAVVLLLAGALYYNASLRVAVEKARAAERVAVERRKLAEATLKELVFRLQDMLGELPATRRARQGLLDTAISGLNEIARTTEADAPNLARAVAHQKLGDIYRQIGRGEEALRTFEISRRLGEELIATSGLNVPLAECLGRSYLGLGKLSIRSNFPEVAKSQIQRAVELTRFAVDANPGVPGARRDLIESHLQLGRAHGFARELAEAETWFGTTRDLARSWAAEEPGNTRAGFFLTFAYRKLGDMRKLNHDPAGSRLHYLEAIRIGREIVAADPGNPEYKLHLGLALHDLGGVLFHQHDLSDAGRRFKEGEELLAELTRFDPDDEEVQFHLVAIRNDLGRLRKSESRYNEAAGSFRKAVQSLLFMEEQGMLKGIGPLPASIDGLKRQIADSEDAPLALGDLDAIRRQPPTTAIRLLLARSRLLAERDGKPGLVATLEALRDFHGGTSEDWFAQALGLGQSLDHLEDSSVRASCADRAVALLGQSLEMGFQGDFERLEHDTSLALLRGHPGFQNLRERLKSRVPR